MAQPVIPLLEDAVHAMRRAPLSTWVAHWTGSVPFALGVLLFWNTVSNPRTGHLQIAAMALLMTFLLVWMNCRRAIFAGRLRHQLADQAVPLRPALAKLLPVQAFLAATKLIALPVSLLVIFPLAQTVAFYRTAAVLAGSEDLEARECIRKAARLAALDPGQRWTLLALLLFFYLAVTLNVAILLGILPQMIRILTGYESSFSRSGVYFIENPLFVLLMFAVSWIAFDPFVQAVYCVRSFHGESMETGEDLRLALRRIVASVLLLWMLAAPLHSAGLSPEDLSQSVRQTMQAHEYDWRLPPSAAGGRSWLVAVTDRFIAGIRSVLHELGQLLDRLFRWLQEKMPGSNPGSPPVAGLHWSVYVITGGVILLAAAIAWRRRHWRRKKTAPAAAEGITPVHLDSDDLTPDRLPEERWIELGMECLGQGDFRLALRAFYLANLAWLGRREFISIHPGKTNREYERELRRRGRVIAPAPELFSANVTAFERVWYGLHDVSADEVAEFRRRAEEMKAVAA